LWSLRQGVGRRRSRRGWIRRENLGERRGEKDGKGWEGMGRDEVVK
jgi:hypothetical protein